MIWPVSRKLPPDEILAALIRLGFRYSDIAARFDVTSSNVGWLAKRLGFPPQPLGSNKKRINGAPPLSYRAKRGLYSVSRS